MTPDPVSAGNHHDLAWKASPRARALAVTAAVAIAVGYVTGHAGIVALAAGPLVLLAFGAATRPPRRLAVTTCWDASRSIEGDPVALHLRRDKPDLVASFTVLVPPTVRIAASRPTPDGIDVDVVANRWGELSCRCELTLTAAYGLRATTLTLQPPPLTVLPRPEPLRTLPAGRRLIPRFGERAGRTPGTGTDFLALRAYRPGQPLRDLNRHASSRGRGWYLTERAADQATDIVIGIDAFDDIGAPGQTTLDWSVRGALGVAHTAIHARDRVGLIVLAGVPRWLRPEAGTRQLTRIIAATLDARRWPISQVDPDLRRIPPNVLAPRSTVVLFSPLLDPRSERTARDLAARGAHVILIDVLRQTPTGPADRHLRDLPMRLWLLQRSAQRAELAALGVLVIPWANGRLDSALATVHAWGAR